MRIPDSKSAYYKELYSLTDLNEKPGQVGSDHIWMILPDREQENQRLRGRCGMENGSMQIMPYYIKNYLGTGLLLRNLARICWLHLRSLTSLPSVGSQAGYSSESEKELHVRLQRCLYQNEVRAEREITSESNDGYSMTYSTGGNTEGCDCKCCGKDTVFPGFDRSAVSRIFQTVRF